MNCTIRWPEYHKIDFDWIREHHNHRSPGAVAKLMPSIDEPHLAPFVDFLNTYFNHRIRIECLHVGYLTEEDVNEKDHDWCYGFPHAHNNGLLSCAIVLQAPEMGGNTMLELTKGDRISFPPIPGEGLIFYDDTIHGVTRVYGATPRIALVAQFELL